MFCRGNIHDLCRRQSAEGGGEGSKGGHSHQRFSLQFLARFMIFILVKAVHRCKVIFPTHRTVLISK